MATLERRTGKDGQAIYGGGTLQCNPAGHRPIYCQRRVQFMVWRRNGRSEQGALRPSLSHGERGCLNILTIRELESSGGYAAGTEGASVSWTRLFMAGHLL
jgi:hypothetical protein